MEERFGYLVGDRVPSDLVAEGRMYGDRAVAVLVGRGALVVGHPDTTEDRQAMEQDALQLLPGRARQRNALPRSFAEAAKIVTTSEQAGWKVQGPRTAEWLVKEMAAQNTTPLARHFW